VYIHRNQQMNEGALPPQGSYGAEAVGDWMSTTSS